MKYKKFSKASLFIIMILPWFSLPLLGKDAFKRYFPSGIFISIIVLIVNFIAKKRRWWRWHDFLSPKITWVYPFTWGQFIVGSMWILKWTYGNFFRYMLVNLIVDGMFTYGLLYILKKFNIFTLVRMEKMKLMYVFMFDALLLYGFQYLKEKLLVNKG
ncbi:hypothetical protein [Sutcliffiella rhizosphaerae]|uniref:Uncharacterized protein n=1 Tax=Sutcliffiella rhizosphaerae TaxID=2880967 RepID=A0ABN8AAR3_9BACI|nr:hypothetical protein [Sutcliffiella rhizosphaerae]CAG9622275.1 hypothetical protein BACCIP111883_03066 [Sutcliffiella rhizosphaerae]